MKVLIAFLCMLMLAAAPASEEAASGEASGVRFTTVDIRIDPAGKALAAYQIEFVADVSRVKLVGVEGGDHPAFASPPYYDPAALTRNRVIVAAFNTGKDLPAGPFRAARLHVQITGSDKPSWQVKPIVTVAADGSAVAATVTLSSPSSPPSSSSSEGATK